MKRIGILCLMILCVAALCLNVSAYDGIQTLESSSTVSSTGQCDVVLTATLIFEQAVAEPVFPVPAEATDLTLNGQRVSPSASGSVKRLPLQSVTGGGAGTFTFTICYTIPGAVTLGENGLELNLFLLSGFAYPVEHFDFQVMLPGEITTEPVFYSSYYQELIELQMDLSVEGNSVSGSCTSLKDHESVSMTLPVTDSMFPQTAATVRVMGVIDVALLIAVVLALVYYLLTLCPHPVRRTGRSTAPDGIGAGDLQMWFTGRGIDLSLMVVTWAQLGYLRIQLEDSGRVLLHKRMDMGNERSVFENRCFKNLFGTRRIVDGTGYHYARLCRSLWSKTPDIREIYRPSSGNPKLFRVLCMLPGLLCGINLASGFAPHSLILKVILAVLTAGLSIVIQSGGAAVSQRHKSAVYAAGILAAVWVILGGFSGELIPSVLMVLFQFLTGFASSHGGKRTDLGQQTREQIIDLRWHMCHASEQELQRLLSANENYFYELAPYALALDVDRIFAKRFGDELLQECSYLIVGNRHQMKPSEWAKLLRIAVQTLDSKAKRLPLEQLTGK